MKFEIDKLAYEYNALEPHIDEQTMRIHHDKHHQTYCDNFNKALDGQEALAHMSAEEMLQKLESIPESIRGTVKNHGGGFVNHNFFWKCLSPTPGGDPKSKLAEAIHQKFGSFEKFQEEFTKAAMGRFGSGWAWLVLNGKELEIISTANQDSPLSEGKIPLLTIDVWEHSYYLKYQNKRADYVTAFWNVVNWNWIEEEFMKYQ